MPPSPIGEAGLRDPVMKRVVVFGGSSAIAQAFLKLISSKLSSVVLVGRNYAHLQEVALDLEARNVGSVDILTMDFTNPDSIENVVRNSVAKLGNVDLALIAHGALLDREVVEQSLEKTHYSFTVNATSVILILTALANMFEKQGSGTIATISSVAGVRRSFGSSPP